MKKTVVALVVILVIGGGLGYALTRPKTDNGAKTANTDSLQTATPSTQDTNTSDGTESTNTPDNTTQSITIKDFSFSPQTLTVKAGTTVTWTNQDSVQHDVTPDTETDEFKQGDLLAKGESYSVTFNTPGTYTYHCSPHPYMKATIIVTE